MGITISVLQRSTFWKSDFSVSICHHVRPSFLPPPNAFPKKRFTDQSVIDHAVIGHPPAFLAGSVGIINWPATFLYLGSRRCVILLSRQRSKFEDVIVRNWCCASFFCSDLIGHRLISSLPTRGREKIFIELWEMVFDTMVSDSLLIKYCLLPAVIKIAIRLDPWHLTRIRVRLGKMVSRVFLCCWSSEWLLRMHMSIFPLCLIAVINSIWQYVNCQRISDVLPLPSRPCTLILAIEFAFMQRHLSLSMEFKHFFALFLPFVKIKS